MNARLLIGVVLVVLGALALAYQGITYTTHKKVLEIGPIQATQEENKTIPVPPIVGVVAMAGGIVLMVTGRKKS